ncbi:DUF1015 domain-containing protein [Propionispora hippei]|uniref:Uncharacterized conserved protein, DUF1015 family n=1 Tax=Propionispora hippei DSM 15287 TaxID=1123003 RepID=A0A1M6BIU9_9FIRM|nr:DUF1015 family protein [Propionispora hippei]SHI48606.1 Uncharacterized conserved protein, DUF1015 family [Propionispora hippei DSM 15287]
MAVIKPFCGVRPAPELAEKVVSLPYDVMDSEEARKITERNPYSFLRVTKSEVDLDRTVDIHGPQVYEKAADNLRRFIAEGILRQDATPCFYIYKQRMGDHVQIGLVAGASVAEYQQNIIKKHELTRHDKELDRVNHITATEAQTGAVFLTYQSDPSINALIASHMRTPVYDFITEDGIGHTLYVVSDEKAIADLEAAFQKVPVMYIADGHHRSAAAARVADAWHEKSGATGQAEVDRFLAVIFPHDMMYIMDYNRVVADLNGITPEAFLQALKEKFDVDEYTAGTYKPQSAHTFGMYLNTGKWYALTAKTTIIPANNPVASLDVSILQEQVLQPLLGIADPRTDKRIHFVGGIRGMAELERLVDSGKFAVAFSMFPTSINELMAIADAGQIMPPKSTWFEPKLRDAMVIHTFVR